MEKFNKVNVGILLAAGTSSRFGLTTPKQLYQIDNKAVISYSADIMSEILDELIVVTNSSCYELIVEKLKHNKNTVVLINDINCRLKSIKTALTYIGDKDVSNIIVHDAARPFITCDHIKTLLNSSIKYLYSHYYLKLINGLFEKSGSIHKLVNRDNYIELCSPSIVDYKLFNFVFKHYIDEPNRITHEFLEIASVFGMRYNLIEGSYKHLRKITTIDDV